jgi:hypothetical protein
MTRILQTVWIVFCVAGCKPTAPPENPLAAQRKAMTQAADTERVLQQQSEQRMKSIDETK